MSRINITSKALASLACTALLFASIGCNPGNVTAPASTPDVVSNPNFITILPTSYGPDKFASQNSTRGKVNQIVSADVGGVVTNGNVTLEFPPGALTEDTEISIEMSEGEYLGVELGPHGTQFNKPVILRMDLSGTNAEGRASMASTLYFNEDFDRFERMEKVFSGDNVMGAKLNHFSRYRGSIGG